MDNILKFIIFIGLSIHIDTEDLKILGSGVARVRHNDMLLKFFVTIQHHGRKARNVFITMVECCEKISDEEVDCDSFRLLDDYIRIMPGTTKNLTLVHPNLYTYNRKGFCLLGIWHRIAKAEKSEEKPTEMQHRVTFDTTVKTSIQEVPPPLVGFYDPRTVIKCDTKDLDPFDACNPVDCHMKYSGFRNFYDRKHKKCQRTPVCIGEPRKELADVVYEPVSNTCRDLERMVTEKDIAEIVSGNCRKMDSDLEQIPVNVQCHHGEIDVSTGLCVCDDGWKSEPYDPDGGTNVYHMCNVQCRRDGPKFPLIPFLIGLFIALWVSLCVCFCERYRFACQFMKKVSTSPQEDCSCLEYVDGAPYVKRNNKYIGY